MREQLRAFLSQHGFLPISDKTWRSMRLQHVPPKSDDEISTTRREIKSAIGNVNGIYVYTDSHDRILYVGKGKPVWNRVYSHYLASFKQVPGDRTGRWFHFFSSHQGTVSVFWKEVEEEAERRIIEEMITLFVSPEFIRFLE